MAKSTEDTNSMMHGDDSPTKSIVVLYHTNCLDGFGAAYAAWCKLGDKADYIPVQYGEPIPVGLDNKLIYLVDFSYNEIELLRLVAISCGVVVLDHHKTAEPNLAVVANAIGRHSGFHYVFDIDKSGAVLTWEYFHPNKPVPDLLLHIQDRDLWQFKLDGTKEICQALASPIWKREFVFWDKLANSHIGKRSDLYKCGDTLLADFKAKCQSLADKAYGVAIKWIMDDTTLFGCPIRDKGLAINAPAEYASEVGNLLAIKSGTYGAVWSYWGAGKYQVSLRSVGDYDVSVIAKYYGGGGHKNASGFLVDKSTGRKLELILQDLTNEPF